MNDEIVFTDSGIDYTETTESFPFNPARGHSPAPWFHCEPDGSVIRVYGKTKVNFTPDSFSVSGTATPMFSLAAFSSGNDYDNGQPHNYLFVKDRPEFVGGKNTDLTPAALAAIESAFRAAREKGAKLAPRFGYAPTHGEGGRGWGIVGAEPDDIAWVVRHIEQVCEVLNRYTDTVFTVEIGTLGPWGEMHSSPYCTDEGIRTVMNAWLDNLDPAIPLQARQMRYFTNYLGVTGNEFMDLLPLGKEHPLYRVGLYNDGYLGSGEDCYTFARAEDDPGQILHRSQGIAFMREQNRRIPYGGELAYVTQRALREGTSYASASPIYEDFFVKELYDTHLCYLHNIIENTTLIKELKAIPFEHRHDFDGMPDLSSYYGRSLFELMNDHMGYRFVLREAKVGLTDDSVVFAGKVENVGFGNLLAPVKAELILFDDTYHATFTPLELDARKWQSTGTWEYRIVIPRPSVPGVYRAYLRLAADYYHDAVPGAYAIRFANVSVWDTFYSANRIGNFTVE